MQLVQRIDLDFSSKGIPPRIWGKQDDSGGARAVVLSLYNEGCAYSIPNGAILALKYRTPSGSFGVYDAMPDGTMAIIAKENTVTIRLVDQIFATPGIVFCELRVISQGASISTWKWLVDVEEANPSDASIPSNYVNILTSLANRVSDDANRAEMAANSIDISSLMPYSDYDPTGVVKSAGGIAAYISGLYNDAEVTRY